ncbi:hypothetical protein LTS08_004840 [Lithohypha guttulata]|uniref:F-box domain-containing protein n=1 Tax=Lithohypha guttulata TaxID=1690604 RepID=A0AAN7T2D2_9EURO|nr:hypothetical protein LTR05_002317 [Lithohypha guttulata]KAK5101233.1 hypothetical protein LTS08_004840 [Lithohypha guttulata]
MAPGESFGVFEPPSPNLLTESMKRLTLKRASSSHGSASSTTNESNTNSSRPSISDSGRRRSSLSSFSSRLRKSTKSRSSTSERILPRIAEKRRSGDWTLGQRFFDLPAEIQTAILAYLDTSELLSLRSTSKASHAIFQANAATIARNALLPTPQESNDQCSPYVLIELYPSLFCSASTDSYLLRCLRRQSLVARQLKIVLAFIQFRSYMLRLTRNLPSEQFAPYKQGLTTRLFQPLVCIQHFFETTRHLIVFSHPDHLSPRLKIDQCPACMGTVKATISTYPENQLVAIYQIMQLLIQHFRTATRSPSSISIFERKLKGWNYGPPPEEHMSQLILLGGLQELSKIDEMQGSYGKRIGVVKGYSELVTEAVRINGLAFPDFYQTQTDPIMAMAMGSGSSKKDKRKQPSPSTKPSLLPLRLSRRDKEDVRTAIEGRADEIRTMKSLDIRLDQLTEGVLASIPKLDNFLVGPETLLAKRIMHLGLVNDERELLNPYGFVTSLMAESYRPADDVEVVGEGNDGNG